MMYKAKTSATDISDSTASCRRINIQMVQNVHLICLDNNIDKDNANCRHTITQLRRVVNDISIFTNTDQCIDFLTDIYTEKFCMIISGALCQNILPLIHDIIQLDTIFILCGNQQRHEQSVKQWSKVKGVFTEISSICEALKPIAQQWEQNTIPISFVVITDDIYKKNLNQLDPTFMYTQIHREIPLSIKFNQEHIKEYINYNHAAFVEKERELKNVDKIQSRYRNDTSIWWYTHESFLYLMLNRMLRLIEMNIFIKIGFFIVNLHHHIQKLHAEQFSSDNTSQIFTVYRDSGMSKTNFKQMTKIMGGSIYFDNFLSTSKDSNVALKFAGRTLSKSDIVEIFFSMTMDPIKSTTKSFVSMVDIGYDGDNKEALFCTHTISRIGKIKSIGENSCLIQMNLTLTNDNNKELHVFIYWIQEEIKGSIEWDSLRRLLTRMNEMDRTHQVYQHMLIYASSGRETERIYEMLGLIKDRQREYKGALEFSEKALEIKQQLLPPNHPNLAYSSDNMSLVCHDMSNYIESFSFYQKALEIQHRSFPLNYSDLSTSYNNIGNVYNNQTVRSF